MSPTKHESGRALLQRFQWRSPDHRVAGATRPLLEAIGGEADDREALLDRANLIPVPRTLPDRYTPRILRRARQLHEEFWETRSGPPEPA